MHGPWTTGPFIVSDTSGAWAPHVIGPVNGVFYNYYVDATGNNVASGVTPTSFTKIKTLIPGGGDPWLFVDDDGKKYLYYAIWVNIGGKGQAVIRVRRMTDYVTLASEPDTQVLIQTPTATWERVTVEGPSVFKRNGTYYMIYAAGALPSTYATGYATASNPMGPWTKYPGNPIMSTGGNIHGPGHGSVIADGAGELWFVYHQQKQPVLVTALWDRVATLDKLVFDANGIMSIRATWGTDQTAPRK
jgi:xylan 1,4-beta-xylosidase